MARQCAINFTLSLGLLLAVPAFAGSTATDNCTGQPTLAGADSGNLVLVPAAQAGFSADQDTSGAGCMDISGGHIDSVYCFRPQFPCNPNFSISANQAGATVALSVRQFLATNTCSDTPTNCVDSGIAPQSVTLTQVQLLSTSLVCVYGAWVGANASYTTQGLDACGALPVELEQFSIDGEPLPVDD